MSTDNESPTSSSEAGGVPEQPKRKRKPRATARAAAQRPMMASEAVGPNGMPFGRKVAQLRKNLGLSQIQLGNLMDRSEAWVSQVERGTRHIDRMSVLEKLASVLMVSVAELTPDLPLRHGEPNRNSPPKAGPLAIAVAERRIATRAGDIDKLETEVDEVLARVAEGRAPEGEPLITLLPRLEAAVRHTDPEVRRRACVAMARTYQAVAAALVNVKDSGAAWVAADRAILAADQAGEPLLAIQGAFKLSLLFHSCLRPDLAERVAIIARDTVQSHGNTAGRQLYGALTLQLAVLAARESSAEEAYERLAEAEQIAAKQKADQSDEYDTDFSFATVRMHEVAIAVDLGDAGRALRAADSFDEGRLSVEKQASLKLSIARAYAQRKDMRDAARSIMDAVDLSPDLVMATRTMIPLVTELRSMDLLPKSVVLDKLIEAGRG